MEALRQAGGAELAALAGAALEARLRRLPLVLDGFVVTAAVAPLAELHPGALANAVAGHRSAEPGHQALLERLGMSPLLDLGMRLGEASGALAAVPLLRLAAAAVTEVATFAEWGLPVPEPGRAAPGPAGRGGPNREGSPTSELQNPAVHRPEE
jgi:nicotinate-nucleotide--dimethylbenzimidazole phosphoribosyltransferase